MIYSFKNSLLATSCLVLSLSLSGPGFSMDVPDDKPTHPASPAIKSKKHVEQTDEGPFLTITDFGNRRFDCPAWVAAIEQSEDPQKKETLFQILERAASKDEGEKKELAQPSIKPCFGLDRVNQEKTPKALRKEFSREHAETIPVFHLEELQNLQKKAEEEVLKQLYLFSIKPCFGLNKVDPERAHKILRKGLLREHGWVVPIYKEKLQKLQPEAKGLIQMKRSGKQLENLTQPQQEALDLLREIVNKLLPDSQIVQNAQVYLDIIYPFDVSRWIDGYVNKLHKETLDELLHKLNGYGYRRYFYELYQIACNLEVQLQQPQRKKPLPGFADIVKRKLDFLKAGEALGDPIALNYLWQYYKSNGQYEESKKILFYLAQEREMVEILFNLGVEYTNGGMLEENPHKSFEWYAKAAEKGMGNAILEVINRFWLTNGDQQDFAKAFKWLKILEPIVRKKLMSPDKEPGDKKLAMVLCQLGRCYHYGHGIEKDEQKAFALFNEAAQLGEENALIHLAMAYQYGNGVDKNLEEAVKRWEIAKKRYPNEFVRMGQCYEDRAREFQQKGQSKNATKYFKQAYAYYADAAQQQDAQAICRMALHHYQGLGRPKDLKLTRDCLTKSAKAGYVDAMYGLGYISLFCQPKNLKLAEEWLNKAAEKGDLRSMVDLGWLYDMEQSKRIEGFNWYKKAADLGSEIAQYNCGLLLLSKHISETDDDANRALSYLHQSAEKGCAPAMTLLGKYYLERSEGTSEIGKQNLESAYFWLEKAAALDNFEAKTLLTEAESKVEPESEGSTLSPDFEQCLKNIENIEKGIIENKQELEIDDKRVTSPFEELKKDTAETESSETESSESDNELPLENPLQTNDSLPLVDELETSFETWKQYIPPKNEGLFQNPKWLREKLREAGLALKRKQETCQIDQAIQLRPGSSLIISMLKNKHTREKITDAHLCKLFSDPYFKAKGHVQVYPTNSGIAIIAKSFEKMESYSANENSSNEDGTMTTGTHRNHSKTYKGYNPEFLKNVVKVLEMFGV